MKYAWGELKNGGIRICPCGEVTLEDDMHLCSLTEEPKMTANPINSIEDRNTWIDFGRQAYLIFLGAQEEGASEPDAIKMVSAFYKGMFVGAAEANQDEEGEKKDV